MSLDQPCSIRLSAPRFTASTPTSFRSRSTVPASSADQDHFHTVGLPDAAVRESRDRVRAALKNCGYDIPPTHITINLAPADIKKEGSGFDLPMALGIVGAYGGLTKKDIGDCLFRRRTVARWRRSRRSRSPAHCHRSPRTENFPHGRPRSRTPKKRPWSAASMSTRCRRCSTSSTSSIPATASSR